MTICNQAGKMSFDYESIKDLAKDNSQSIRDLLALAPQNDPFYVGSPGQLEAARWFSDIWQRFKFVDGVTLREVHYAISNPGENVYKPNGEVYENSELDWNFISKASKWARYLDLVDPDAFVERRNLHEHINTSWAPTSPEPDYYVRGQWSDYDYQLPNLPDLPSLPRELPDLPYLLATGYDGIQQAYHVEIWAEKTTQNKVLEPICRRYSVNLVTGAGEMSITSVRNFLARVKAARRPARILYISDYDPAGLGMPISVARKVEYYQRTNGAGALDIALQPIVLTADQVKSYRLPRIPVKESDKRKANFEAAHGEGQVELDALQGIYPGELAKIVAGEILKYIDPDLPRRALEVKDSLQDDLNNQEGGVKTAYRAELGSLKGDYGKLLADFENTRAQFAELVKQFGPEIEAYRDRLQDITDRAGELHTRLYSDLQQVFLDMRYYSLPEPEISGDPDNLLYHSGRDYLGQLAAYKARRNNN